MSGYKQIKFLFFWPFPVLDSRVEILPCTLKRIHNLVRMYVFEDVDISKVNTI